MKTVLFIPGFRENMENHDYASVLKAIESKGYLVRFVPIRWDRTTLDDWLEELESAYAEHDAKQTVLAGFSFGSLIAFVAATKRPPAELWLFSFSPYFSDDIPKLKKSWKKLFGHRRITAFSKLDFGNLTSKISCPTLLMLGSIEAKKYPLLLNRSMIAHRSIKSSKYLVTEGADHDVTDKNYINAIKNAIG